MEDLMKRLKDIAWLKSVAFCYSCYQAVTTCSCTSCGSDDNMRLLPGIGAEYGTDWIISHLIEENLEPADLDTAFEDLVREVNSETVQVAWLTVDTVEAAKQLDPISWKLAQDEWVDAEVSDERLITFDHGETYYWVDDVERYVASQEEELEDAS